MRHTKYVAAWLLCVAEFVRAAPISLQEGLIVDPPEQLDLTYQILPEYDEKEQVIAGWSGDKLEYFIAFGKLPAGYSDAQSYLAALGRDLRRAWGGLEIGKQTTYRTPSGMSGTAVILSKPPSSKGGNRTTLIAHHLTDGRVAFLATVTVMSTASVETASEYGMRILSTARFSRAN